MIRPASEIEYPPSEALCTKARMLARMEEIGKSAESLTAVIAARLSAEEQGLLKEIEAHAEEQDRLIRNMKRMLSN